MPIEPALAAVFVPVSHMRQSIDWYSQLLDLPADDTSHDGQIYELPLHGPTVVMLDAHGSAPITPSAKPLLMFTATDLDEAHHRARSISTNVSTPEDIGSVVVFYLTDPDGHRICIKVPQP